MGIILYNKDEYFFEKKIACHLGEFNLVLEDCTQFRFRVYQCTSIHKNVMESKKFLCLCIISISRFVDFSILLLHLTSGCSAVCIFSFVSGSNYDSLFVRTVAFPVQVAYWIKEVMAPRGYSVPCQL